MPPGVQTFFLLLNGAILLLSLFFFYREAKLRGDCLPLYLLLGACLAIIYEPIGDILISAFWPHQGQLAWFEAAGRKIPVFIALLYPWYMAAPPLILMRQMKNGLTLPGFWRMYAATFAIAFLYEALGVNLGAWVYYGPQPTLFFGVPVWIVFSFSGFVVALSTGVYFLDKVLSKHQQWVYVFVIPILLAASHCALALPGVIAMYTNSGMLLNYLGAAGTILLTLIFVWLSGLALFRRDYAGSSA